MCVGTHCREQHHHPRICCTGTSGCEAQSQKQVGESTQASLWVQGPSPSGPVTERPPGNFLAGPGADKKPFSALLGRSQSNVEQQLFPQQNLPAWIHPLDGQLIPFRDSKGAFSVLAQALCYRGGSRGSQRGSPAPPGPSRVTGRTRSPSTHL